MLQGENFQLRSKLEECTKQLKSNEQMIRWLNNQVDTNTYTIPFKYSVAVRRLPYWQQIRYMLIFQGLQVVCGDN